jgi:hypothetical protein
MEVTRKPINDSLELTRSIEKFQFRNLHPKILMGTASDRYAGWIGQIYTKERYEGRISRRTTARYLQYANTTDT